MAGKTIAEHFVGIGADTSQFDREMKSLEAEMRKAGEQMAGSMAGTNREFDKMRSGMSPLTSYMKTFGAGGKNSLEGIKQQTELATAQLNEFKDAVSNGGLTMDKEYTQAQDKLKAVRQEMSMLTSLTTQYGPELATSITNGMKPMFELQSKQKEIKKKFAELTFDTARFKGDSALYMDEIAKVGAAQKKLNDEMMKNNTLAKQGIIQQAGYFANLSTQSEKISANFDRMNQPFAKLTGNILKVGQHLEKTAAKGNAAVIALKHLGPDANMKQLNDYIRMINTGLMRTQMLSMGMGIVFVGALIGINKLLEHNGLTKMSDQAKILGDTLNTSLLPFLKSFDAFAALILKGVTAVADLWANFSKMNPEIAAGVGWFALLFIGLMVLLAPLAVGIGLTGGLTASFSALWLVISPFVIGFLTVAGTALVIAAALVAVGVAIALLWNNTTWFKEAVIGAWEAIKNGTAAAWAAIVAFVKPAIEAIKTFIGEKLDQIKAFWDENGAMIMQAVQNVWTVISTIIGAAFLVIWQLVQWLWPGVKAVILNTWEAIKQIIDGALKIIMGVIKFFAALFTGDWGAMWEAFKEILTGALDIIMGIVRAFGPGQFIAFFKGLASQFIGIIKDMWNAVTDWFVKKTTENYNNVKDTFNKIISFLSGLEQTFYNAGKGLIEQMVNGIKNAASKAVEAVKDLAGKVRDFLPFSPAKEGPLSDLNHLDFGGPIADSINGSIPRVRDLMGELLALPDVRVNNDFSDGNKESSILNFERMFDGATINVREDKDITKVARELYDLSRNRGRGLGVSR